MIDMHTQFVMKKINEAWKQLANILSDDELTGTDTVNVMLSINARYLHACSHLSKDHKNIIKDEYLKLLDEKLG